MKTKTLFDHIKQITNVQNQLYWDNITDADKKTWSNYMVHRFLSMKAEWIEVVNEIQQYWELKPKTVYQFFHFHTMDQAAVVKAYDDFFASD